MATKSKITIKMKFDGTKVVSDYDIAGPVDPAEAAQALRMIADDIEERLPTARLQKERHG